MSALDAFPAQILSGFLQQGLSLPALSLPGLSLPGLSLPGFVFPSGVLPNAAVAYVHYLSFMVCFGALVLERRLIKADPARGEAILMVVTDVVYGIAALAVLVSGILRVLHYGQGSSFYTEKSPCSGGRWASTWLSAHSPCIPRSPTSSGRFRCARVICPK